MAQSPNRCLMYTYMYTCRLVVSRVEGFAIGGFCGGLCEGFVIISP